MVLKISALSLAKSLSNRRYLLTKKHSFYRFFWGLRAAGLILGPELLRRPCRGQRGDAQRCGPSVQGALDLWLLASTFSETVIDVHTS